MSVELPAEAAARLQAEADRRGVSVDAVIAELAEQLPPEAHAESDQLPFLAVGASAHGSTPYIDQLLADGFGRD